VWYFDSEGEPTLHVTEVGTFLECPHRWAMKRRGEWTELVGAPMVRGKAAHKARRRAIEGWLGISFDDDGNELLLKDGPPKRFPTYQELCEIGRDEVARYCDEEGQLHTEAAEPIEGSEVLADAARYIELDVKSVLPGFIEHVEKSEHRLTVPLKVGGLQHDWHLTGQVDCLAREPTSRRLCNRDMKTGKFDQLSADVSDQPTGYSMLIEAEYGERPIHVFDVARFLKNPPRKLAPGGIVQELDDGTYAVSETIQTDRNKQDAQGFGEKIAFVLQLIEGEVFPPAGTGFLTPCARCPFQRDCDYCSTAGGNL
jgi:hypothetical protein